MSRARPAILAILVVVVVAAVLVLRGGDDPYRLRMQLDNAAGLRDGSQVAVGGLNAGTVRLEVSPDRRKVLATIELDRDHAPVGKDVRASIASVNLLGQKRVELDVGDRDDPAPDGYRVPERRVDVATDLDQVLGVLDADTRTRLRVMINETGAAFAGREADLDHFVFELPESFASARRLLDALVGDNHTLARLVRRSSAFVGEIAGERSELGALVDAAGRAGTTLAARRGAMRATLARTPATLQRIRAFLGRLETTSGTLAPAARQISATAPALEGTLAKLEPFRRSAMPALDAATAAAPRLTRLATRATPVVRRATPVLSQLGDTATALGPVSASVSRSADNLLGTVNNWAHAVQLRDRVSRIFRGELAISPDALESILRRAAGTGPNPVARNRSSAAGKRTAGRPTAPTPSRPSPAAPPTVSGAPKAPPARPSAPSSGLPGLLQDGLRGLLGGGPRPGTTGADPSRATPPDGSLGGLLGRLLEGS